MRGPASRCRLRAEELRSRGGAQEAAPLSSARSRAPLSFPTTPPARGLSGLSLSSSAPSPSQLQPHPQSWSPQLLAPEPHSSSAFSPSVLSPLSAPILSFSGPVVTPQAPSPGHRPPRQATRPCPGSNRLAPAPRLVSFQPSHLLVSRGRR